MQAAISGIARKAIIVDGDSVKFFDVDNPSQVLDCQRADIPYIFGEGLDLRFVADTDIKSVAAELKSESNLRLALDLTLISLDSELEDDIRRDAFRDLDGLIRDEDLVSRLENIMYARPLPEAADVETALAICKAAEPNYSFSFLTSLARRQSVISDVSAAWDVIPTKTFGGDDQKTEFQRVAVQLGLFQLLVIAVGAGKMSEFLIKAGLDSAVQQMRNARQVLQRWVEPFRGPRASHGNLLEMEDDREIKVAVKRRRGRRIDVDRPAVLREVNRRKAEISTAISRRDLPLIRSLVKDLIDYHRQSGDTEHLAKSLCDLATEAKNLGMFSLQLELTEKSIGETPDDGWSWVQYTDALLNVGRSEDALRACEQADAFGAGLIAKIRRAEILTGLGRYLEALAVYDLAMDESPDNVIALNGTAEVLKELGYIDEALEAYNLTVRNHPEDTVALIGRCEVLKMSGDLHAALDEYDAIIMEFPENAVALVGRADVLRSLGDFKNALAAYNDVITRYPEMVTAQTGRAEVLKEMGNLEDALAAFDATVTNYPENIVAKTGRAETLKAIGRWSEALVAYQDIRDKFPEYENARIVTTKTPKEPLKAWATPQIALALERAAWQERANHFQLMSITDPLTGLHNRRYLQARLAEELSRARSYNYPFSFMIIDLDDFKIYNDRNGHRAGDRAIEIAAQCLRALLRKGDVASRYGGEEFAILLPRTTLEEAGVIADGIRRRILSTPFPHGKTQPLKAVTVSVGLSALSPSLDSAEAIVTAADRALYHAKEQGKDRAYAYQGTQPVPEVDHITPYQLSVFDETLAAHEAAVTYYSCDILTKNGLAETLKELGRLREALDVY